MCKRRSCAQMQPEVPPLLLALLGVVLVRAAGLPCPGAGAGAVHAGLGWEHEPAAWLGCMAIPEHVFVMLASGVMPALSEHAKCGADNSTAWTCRA